MAAEVALCLATILAFLVGVEGWRCAKYQHYFSQQPDYIDCVWDCCGNSFNRHCCAPIGIIVGCCIVGAVVIAALVVAMACWWQRRRSRYSKGPRLFHNRKHSHYPVAPTSVTRPAPLMPQPGGPEKEGQIYRPPHSAGYPRPPPSTYRPRPSAPIDRDPERKVPPTDFYEPGPPRGPPQGPGYPPEYRRGPPPFQEQRQGPPREDYNRGPPPQGYRQGPPPGSAQRQGPPQQRPPVREYFD